MFRHLLSKLHSSFQVHHRRPPTGFKWLCFTSYNGAICSPCGILRRRSFPPEVVFWCASTFPFPTCPTIAEQLTHTNEVIRPTKTTIIDNQRVNLPRNVVELLSPPLNNCRVFIIGTVHRYKSSKKAVRRLVSIVRPQSLFLEVDDEDWTFMSDDNCEFKSACKEFEQIHGSYDNVVLGDDPNFVKWLGEVEKGLGVESGHFEHLSNLYYEVFSDSYEYERPFHMSSTKRFKIPWMRDMVIEERDLYMTRKLRLLSEKNKSVVAVVGKAHVSGIIKTWKSWSSISLSGLIKMGLLWA